MKKLTLAGHPLHPQLVAGPIALLPFSFVMDLMYHGTGDECYADSAFYGMVGGVASGLAAGASGAADYLTIESGSERKKVANTHAILNLSIMGAAGAMLARRIRRREPSIASTVLSGICTIGLVISQWYGGRLVYEHGMRVQEQRESQARLPGDRAIERGLERMEQPFPERGPAMVS